MTCTGVFPCVCQHICALNSLGKHTETQGHRRVLRRFVRRLVRRFLRRFLRRPGHSPCSLGRGSLKMCRRYLPIVGIGDRFCVS